MKTTNVKFLVVLLISLFSVKASAHNIEVKNADGVTIYYNYINNNSELEVSYRGNSYDSYSYEYSGNVVIPESVTYNGKTYSVTSIGWGAFYGCSGLTSVTIPNSVTSIGVGAFQYCSGLTSVTIPNSVTSIGSSAFRYCSGLTSVTIPNSVTSIGGSAFQGCSGLTSVTIPNSVTSIGDYAFYWCSGLTSVTIPNSVTSIGNYAFDDCNKMKAVYSEIESPFDINDNSFGANTYAGTLHVPANTKSKYLQANGWKKFTNIVEVQIVENITFADATLKAICVANWDTNGDGELSKDEAAAVTDLGTRFSNNTNITSFDELQYFVGLTQVNEYAFNGCSGLTSVTIPNSVTSIGDWAFRNCSSLTSVTIPNSVTSIGWYTFSGCSGLTSVTIPNSVTSIGESAFYGCGGLTSVTIPNSVMSIGGDAFANCSSLTSITIPNSVTSIGSSAFDGCYNLKTVYSEIKVPFNINENVFSAQTYAGTLHVPAGRKAKYQQTNGWKKFTNIVEPQMEENISFADENVKAICVTNWDTDGDGELSVDEAAAVTDLGTKFRSSSITSFDELQYFVGLTLINENAFWGCFKLTSVTIPNSVTSIGNSAFYLCSVTSVIIPNSVTSIGNSAFYLCSLTSVTIPNSVTSIGDSAFEGCSSLTSITIPNSVTSIGNYAFSGCWGLTSVTIGNSVTSIGNYAFSGCSNLKTVYSEIESPFAINDNVFSTQTYAGTLQVPANTKAKYQQTNGWKKFANIVDPTHFSLTIMATGNGSAAYNGTMVRGTTRTFDVTEGTTATITFTPDNGYRIKTVKVNGVTVSVTNNQYTISNVTANTTVEVTFVEIPSGFTGNDLNYTVTSFDERQVKVTGGNYGNVLTVPATVTYQDETWKVVGIESGMLANNSQLAAIVWEPEAAFTESVSNPNLLLYVKSADYAPVTIRNVVVNGTANNIILTDAINGNDFYCPQEFTARIISYTHNYSMATGIGESKGWESIALPFDVAKTVHASKGEIVPYQKWDGTDSKKPFWLMELGASGFVKANAIKANTPYIISMPNHQNYREDYRLNGSITFSAENVRVKRTDDLSQASSGDKTFVPNFTNKQGTGVYALNVNSDYVTYSGGSAAGSRFVINLRALHPFEAYMTSASAARTSIVIGDNLVTGIDDISAMIDERAVIRVYLPSGQLVVAEKDKSLDEVKAQLPAGVYIVNGQKLIIK